MKVDGKLLTNQTLLENKEYLENKEKTGLYNRYDAALAARSSE